MAPPACAARWKGEPGVASDTTLEALLKRDRAVVIAGLTGVIVLAWAYILLGAGMDMTAFEMTRMSQPVGLSQPTDMAPDMAPDRSPDMTGGTADDADQTPTGMAGSADGDAAAPSGGGEMSSGGGTMTQVMDMAMAAMRPMAWTAGTAVVMFFMWWIMMVAMMLPSAAPMILLFAAVNRKQREAGSPFVPTGIFAFGYLAVWAFFSLLAVIAQWGLEQTELLSSMMVGTSVVLGALLLIAAGVWQLTPLKHACLKHCRSPLHFLSHHWHKGRLGAFRMGVEHGAFCLGCCWFLMALLFYGGVMNLYWIVGLAAFVLIEKVVPYGHGIGSVAGVGLLAWGGLLLAGSL
jgi:predicted metal-binding membrane protein